MHLSGERAVPSPVSALAGQGHRVSREFEQGLWRLEPAGRGTEGKTGALESPWEVEGLGSHQSSVLNF